MTPDDRSDYSEPLDPKSAGIREVYARFGLAMYHAQVLEHGVVNALVMTHRSKDQSVTADELELMFENRFEKTLGRLIAELSRYVPVPPSLCDELKNALSTRNFLAHGYFKVRAEAFLTGLGRERMVRELQKFAERLKYVDGRLEPLTEAAFEKMGVTKKALEAHYRQYLARFSEEGS